MTGNGSGTYTDGSGSGAGIATSPWVARGWSPDRSAGRARRRRGRDAGRARHGRRHGEGRHGEFSGRDPPFTEKDPATAARDLRLRPLRRRRRRPGSRRPACPARLGGGRARPGAHRCGVAPGLRGRRAARGRDRSRKAPLVDLIEANRQDQVVTRYPGYQHLEAYCALSANPIGRLVLAVFGRRDAESVEYSDRVCTALQLVEHFQDVAEDFAAGRVYLPAEDLTRFGSMSRRSPPGRRRRLSGGSWPSRRLAPAGSSIRAARSSRSCPDGPRRGRRVCRRRARPARRHRTARFRRPVGTSEGDEVPGREFYPRRVGDGGEEVAVTDLATAYDRCEAITRREARNFFYGIRLLPAPKRAAMSALYAFARRVDDIGDGPARRTRSAGRSRRSATRSPGWPAATRLPAMRSSSRSPTP